MAEPLPEHSAHVPLRDLLRLAAGSLVGAGFLYLFLWGFLDGASLQNLPYRGAIEAGISIAIGVLAFGYAYRNMRQKAREQAFEARIDEELKKSAGDGGADAVAAVSTAEVAKTVTGDTAEAKKAEAVVERRKQRLLVDAKTLSAELAYLVDNWQPLPRDVKRAVNRFCVTYLVAYNRGLLKDPPVVSGFQLAKWLALSERWPQLGRALAMSPEAIDDLEDYAGPAVAGQAEAFAALVAALAPQHSADQELRKFIKKEPQLSAVLPRLVQYGMAQPVPASAVTVQQTVPLPEADAPGTPVTPA